MKRMQPTSARTLTIFAAILLVTGCIIMSPSGAVLAFSLSLLSALFPAVFGKGKVRIIAAILLFVSIGLCLGKYPEFMREQAAYRQHVISHGQKQP